MTARTAHVANALGGRQRHRSRGRSQWQFADPPCSSPPRSLRNGDTLSLALAGDVSTSHVAGRVLYRRASGLPPRRPSPREALRLAAGHRGTDGLPDRVTQTVAADGTSAFSAPLSVVPATTVIEYQQTAGRARSPTRSPAPNSGVPAATGTSRSRSPDPDRTRSTLASTLSISMPLTIDGTSELTSQGTPGDRTQQWRGCGQRRGPGHGLDGSTIEGLQFSGFTGPDDHRGDPGATRSAARPRRGERRWARPAPRASRSRA